MHPQKYPNIPITWEQERHKMERMERMENKVSLSVEVMLSKGTEAKAYKRVTDNILKEEANKLHGISQQADNWSTLAHHAVGAKEL